MAILLFSGDLLLDILQSMFFVSEICGNAQDWTQSLWTQALYTNH